MYSNARLKLMDSHKIQDAYNFSEYQYYTRRIKKMDFDALTSM